MKTVVMGMSGGVDSSVAAALLVDKGYRVQGITLQTWEPETEESASKKWQERGCCKVGIARYVADRLKIDHRVVDIRDTFRSAVVDDFIRGYLSGQTPNPCVRCNERVKFGVLVRVADEVGADYVATGHYAQVLPDDKGCLQLYKGCDAAKDQSYFLYRINRKWLSRLLFPVGGMRKEEVWERAEEIGLPADEIKESQEICFVTQGDYREFLSHHAPEAERPGAFINLEGARVGTHRGTAFYTPGQRRGLGVATANRLYVVRIDACTNTVVLGNKEDLVEASCLLEDVNLLGLDQLNGSLRAQVKIRYATPAVSATVSSGVGGQVVVQFDAPQSTISPGQSAVLYNGDMVLGGGIICTHPCTHQVGAPRAR
jgi:tRNA-specific 2-thiouridylase